ncbi:MAG TPA: twin-arginine translocase subunit TatC [Ktedonobacteraceae bacterium]|nr:twin-arginine translocase subunit TatC [Ktedonobacteraceae bacterium]
MASNRLDEQDLVETMFAPGEDDENDPSAMSLVDHLEELRRRIFKSLIAIVVGTIVAFIFRDQIVHFLELPLPKEAADTLGHGNKLIVTGITEGFSVFLLVSAAAGFMLALPVVLYQTWAFIAPGLLEKEKKYSVPFIVAGMILFALGVSLGFIVLRYPVEWLVTFASDSFTELLTAGSYFTFVAFFMLAFGLVFELPLVLTFLAQVDLITSRTLIRKRTGAHIGLWIASTFLTPGADIYSPIFLGVSMSFLYELSIIFIKITKK